ncbi:hypothetical protein BH20CHL3_BH20CHL3_10100 [soil metagenome]
MIPFYDEKRGWAIQRCGLRLVDVETAPFDRRGIPG